MIDFEFKFTIDNVLVDPDTLPVTYGVVRDDTNAEVVAPGTAMDHDLSFPGVFTASFAEVAGVTSYTATIIVQNNGSTYTFDKTLTVTVDSPTSPWINYEEFVRKWGKINIATATNKDRNSKEPDFDVVQDAFDQAKGEIDEAFFGSMYTSPLDFGTDSVPRRVRRWASVIAYGLIHEGRGLEEKGSKSGRIKTLVDEVWREVAMVKAGIGQINAATAVASSGQSVNGSICVVRVPGFWCRNPDEAPIYPRCV